MDLLNESRGQLLHTKLHTRALAILVLLLTAGRFNTNNLASILNIQNFSKVQLLQRHSNRNFHIRRALLLLLLASTTKSTKTKMFKNVERVGCRLVSSVN